MNITTIILNDLRAMGANPETAQNAAGETIIKVNAPIINGGNGGTNEKTENKKT